MAKTRKIYILIWLILVNMVCLLFVDNVFADTEKYSEMSCTYQSTEKTDDKYLFLDINFKYRYSEVSIKSVNLYKASTMTDSTKEIVKKEAETETSIIYPTYYRNFEADLYYPVESSYASTNYTTKSKLIESLNNNDNKLSKQDCPSGFYIDSDNNFFAYNEEAQSKVKAYLDAFNISYNQLDYKVGVATEVDDTSKPLESGNYQSEYDRINDKITKNCDVENQTEEQKTLCTEAKKELESLQSQVEDVGLEIIDSKLNYSWVFNNRGESCDGLLGSINNPGEPAYYLNIVFDIMKYIAILALFALTIFDIIKTITSNSNDGTKKIINAVVKRLIIVALLFFLPSLINFILNLLGIVNTDPLCGIK